MLLRFPLSPPIAKDVIRGGIPGIVNAHKEEQQHRGTNDKQGWTRLGMRHGGRSSQHRIRRTGQQHMKHPLLQDGPLGGLSAQTPRHDHGVDDPTEAQVLCFM